MSGFDDVVFPMAIGLGARKQIERRTEIVTLSGGKEFRNALWRHGRRRFDLDGVAMTLDQVHALQSFFEARLGPLKGFRFRDITDHKSCAPSVAPSPVDQTIALGDGTRTSFQITKTYGAGSGAYARAITKPVSGSVRIALNGVETTNFTLNALTGVVSLAVAPANGVAVTAGFVFDTPVRFEMESFQIVVDGPANAHVAGVTLLEIA